MEKNHGRNCDGVVGLRAIRTEIVDRHKNLGRCLSNRRKGRRIFLMQQRLPRGSLPFFKKDSQKHATNTRVEADLGATVLPSMMAPETTHTISTVLMVETHLSRTHPVCLYTRWRKLGNRFRTARNAALPTFTTIIVYATFQNHHVFGFVRNVLHPSVRSRTHLTNITTTGLCFIEREQIKISLARQPRQ